MAGVGLSRAALLDLDGTLIDTAPDLWRATNHILASLGRRPITLKDVRAFVGHGARALISRGKYFLRYGAHVLVLAGDVDPTQGPNLASAALQGISYWVK